MNYLENVIDLTNWLDHWTYEMNIMEVSRGTFRILMCETSGIWLHSLRNGNPGEELF